MATHLPEGFLRRDTWFQLASLLHVISKQEISPLIAEHVSWLPEVYSLN